MKFALMYVRPETPHPGVAKTINDNLPPTIVTMENVLRTVIPSIAPLFPFSNLYAAPDANSLAVASIAYRHFKPAIFFPLDRLREYAGDSLTRIQADMINIIGGTVANASHSAIFVCSLPSFVGILGAAERSYEEAGLATRFDDLKGEKIVFGIFEIDRNAIKTL